MQALRDIIKSPTVTKSRRSEWGDIFDYFFSLGMKDKNGRALSRGAIGFYLSALIRAEKDYSLLYALQKRCELSEKPQAVFWSFVKLKNK